ARRPPARAHPRSIPGFPCAMKNPVSIRWLPTWIAGLLLLALPPASDTTRAASDQQRASSQGDTSYKPPSLAIPESMQPLVDLLEPGKDAFPLEAQVRELETRLAELSDGLRAGRTRVAAVLTTVFDQEFRGGRLLPPDEPAINDAP